MIPFKEKKKDAKTCSVVIKTAWTILNFLFEMIKDYKRGENKADLIWPILTHIRYWEIKFYDDFFWHEID